MLCLNLIKTTDSTRDDDTKAVQIIQPLKYLSNFWENLDITIINCQINLILFTKLYVPVVTLSTQDTVKLLQQLKSGFQHTIKWNKFYSKAN